MYLKLIEIVIVVYSSKTKQLTVIATTNNKTRLHCFFFSSDPELIVSVISVSFDNGNSVCRLLAFLLSKPIIKNNLKYLKA